MTAVLPERATVPDVQAVIGAGLIRALGLTGPDPEFVESIESGLTESYTAYCTRLDELEATS